MSFDFPCLVRHTSLSLLHNLLFSFNELVSVSFLLRPFGRLLGWHNSFRLRSILNLGSGRERFSLGEGRLDRKHVEPLVFRLEAADLLLGRGFRLDEVL